MAEVHWNKGGVVGTWAAVIVALFEIWQHWPKSEGAAIPMRAWIIPAALVFALVLAGALHLAAVLIARKKQAPRRVATSSDECPDKWLHDVAKSQAGTTDLLVKVDKVEVLEHELMRDHPYVEFKVFMSSCSIYRLSIDDLKGSIRFAGRLFSESPQLLEEPGNGLEFTDQARFIVRQPLSHEDKVALLNKAAEFDFKELSVNLQSPRFSFVAPQRLYLQRRYRTKFTLSNEKLLAAYPKLNIEIRQAFLTSHYNFDEKPTDAITGSLITLQIEFRNPRSSQLRVKDFKLDTSPHVERITSASSGLIYGKVWMENGKPENRDRLTPNLKDDVPIEADREEPIEGWLQFYLSKVKPGQLNGRAVNLMIVDDTGVEHVIGTPVLSVTYPDLHAG